MTAGQLSDLRSADFRLSQHTYNRFWGITFQTHSNLLSEFELRQLRSFSLDHFFWIQVRQVSLH